MVLYITKAMLSRLESIAFFSRYFSNANQLACNCFLGALQIQLKYSFCKANAEHWINLDAT